MDESCLDLDSVPLSNLSDSPSPNDSTSPSSSSFDSSPPRSTDNVTLPSYKLSVSNLSYTIIKPRCNSSINPLIFTGFFSNNSKSSKNNKRSINVLNSVSFTAYSGELLAVVGPSGAGKSTLLRVISGRVPDSEFDPKSVAVSGCIISNPHRLRNLCGFVMQEDNLLPLLTVKETLMFSAKFRLKKMDAKERERRVEALIHELGLTQVADSYIGDEENRGISGGERKRVAIGVDVIHDPPILLLDEPTSGLDSSSALQVTQLLTAMARNRRQVVIITIHQPSYRILNYISSFLLLWRGRVAHSGTLASLKETIYTMGFTIPPQVNTLEFAMEVVKELEEHNSKQNKIIVHRIGSTTLRESLTDELHGYRDYCSSLDEIIALACRFWKVIYRTKQLFLARTIQAFIAGLGLGSVYLNIKMDTTGVTERLGFFAFSLSFLLSSTVEALPIFLQERRVLMKETSRKMYRLSSYMIANTLIFLPFLFLVAIIFSAPVYWLVGLNPSVEVFAFFVMTVWLITLMASSLVLFLSAISTDYILGNSLICLFLGVFFLFSGYFIPKESIPKYWMFMYYLSLYRYPLDTLVMNEYLSLKNKCFSWQEEEVGESSEMVCLLTGADVLRARGLEKDTRWINVGIMIGFFLVYRVLCWIVLVRKASKTKL